MSSLPEPSPFFEMAARAYSEEEARVVLEEMERAAERARRFVAPFRLMDDARLRYEWFNVLFGSGWRL